MRSTAWALFDTFRLVIPEGHAGSTCDFAMAIILSRIPQNPRAGFMASSGVRDSSACTFQERVASTDGIRISSVSTVAGYGEINHIEQNPTFGHQPIARFLWTAQKAMCVDGIDVRVPGNNLSTTLKHQILSTLAV